MEKNLADYILLRSAQRYLERMQPDDQVRIINALDALITDSTGLDIKPIKININDMNEVAYLVGREACDSIFCKCE